MAAIVHRRPTFVDANEEGIEGDTQALGQEDEGRQGGDRVAALDGGHEGPGQGPADLGLGEAPGEAVAAELGTHGGGEGRDAFGEELFSNT
jgi:hypothetical protein